MDGEYPCSCTQPPMNRTILCCRAVSAGSGSGPPDAWSAVMLFMSPLRSAGPSPDDVMLHVNAEKQNPVLEICSARTHLLSARRLPGGVAGVNDTDPVASVAA